MTGFTRRLLDSPPPFNISGSKANAQNQDASNGIPRRRSLYEGQGQRAVTTNLQPISKLPIPLLDPPSKPLMKLSEISSRIIPIVMDLHRKGARYVPPSEMKTPSTTNFALKYNPHTKSGQAALLDLLYPLQAEEFYGPHEEEWERGLHQSPERGSKKSKPRFRR